MRKDGLATKEKILIAANKLVMASGYGGTTVDEVIAGAEITKGAFFHHFKSKEALARELVARYVKTDCTLLDEIIQLAEQKTSDPVQQLLAIVGRYIELLEVDPHPEGCLYASYCYESGLMEDATLKPVQDAVLYWRKRMGEKISAAIAHRPPRVAVDAAGLADYFLSTFEGGFVLARTLKQPQIIVEQLKQFRTYLAALFN
jgi:TetR/AcrR family transcriptional repressor of nem operon